MADTERPFPAVSKPVGEELAKLAHKLAKEKGIPYAVALAEVGTRRRDLAHRARVESLNRKYHTEILDTSMGRISVVTSLSEVVARRAHERASQKGITYSEALSEIRQESPELMQAARAQVVGEF